MKRKTVFAVISAVAVICLAVILTLHFTQFGSTYYYTQIDNTKIQQVDSRGGVIDFNRMDYSYTLAAYDEKGKEKEIKFGVSKELKEGAFLRLKFIPVRGVTDWCEVKFDELPEKVKDMYKTAKDKNN